MKKMNKKGFTLIEMLVVIAIIAILVAIIIPTVTSATDKANAAADAANLRSAQAVVTIGLLDGTYSETKKPSATDLKVPEKSKLTGGTFACEITGTTVTVKYGENDINYFADIASGTTKYTKPKG